MSNRISRAYRTGDLSDGSLPTTFITGDNQAYTTPGATTRIRLVMTGSNDTVTSDAATLAIVANGQGDSAISGSAVLSYVVGGIGDSLTLTGAGQTASVDLTHAPRGLAAAMQITGSNDLVVLAGGGGAAEGQEEHEDDRGHGTVRSVPADALPWLMVTGSNNKLVLGSQSVGVSLVGNLNLVVGASGVNQVTLNTNTAAGNVVLGGTGPMTVTSTAAATDVIGGSGTVQLNIDGVAANIVGGAGQLTGAIHSDGGVLQTGSGGANLVLTGLRDDVATGSGRNTITYGDGTGNSFGGILYQASAAGFTTFNVNADGSTAYGGNVVNATGNGIQVESRAAFQTDAGGAIAAQFQTLGEGVYAALLPDPDVTAALLAANPYALPPGLTPVPPAGPPAGGGMSDDDGAGWGGGFGQHDHHGGGVPPVRIINFNVNNGSVYSDSVAMQVTVNGSNDSLYGGSVGQHYVIQSGQFNSIWAGAGNNTYIGDGQNNVLEYYLAPQPVTVDFAKGVATNGYGGVDSLSNLFWAEAGAGSTLIGGTHDAILTSFGDGSTLQGGSGNDVLTANGNNSTLLTGSGSDTLHTTGTGSHYEVGGTGAVPLSTIITQDAVGATGTLSFLAGTTPGQLWLGADAAGDLVIDVLGTANSVTVQNWFAPGGPQLARVDTATGWLDTDGVNTLEAAMAGYQAANAGFDPTKTAALPADPGLAAAYAAAWKAI